MEAFESFVAVALEADDFVVSPAVKFPVRRRTRKQAYEEYQEHGYEVDLVGARGDKLVLATVKSFFGSHGVTSGDVIGESARAGGYALLNDKELRKAVLTAAARRYQYSVRDVELRLYVGKFAGATQRRHEQRIREWARKQRIGAESASTGSNRSSTRSAKKLRRSNTAITRCW